ncbi:hypothetical protein GQ457_08G016450 [Hibiscus cannabinus]
MVETAIGADMNQTMDGKNDGDRTTCASKVVTNGSSGNVANGSTRFLEDEVTILEDDLILDRTEPTPSIQFSDHFPDQIDHNLWNALIVRLLGRSIGYNVIVVRVDYNTKDGARGKLCLAIAVDLNQPLILCVKIDGKLQKLEYEGINNICFNCGVHGHSKDLCPPSQR